MAAQGLPVGLVGVEDGKIQHLLPVRLMGGKKVDRTPFCPKKREAGSLKGLEDKEEEETAALFPRPSLILSPVLCFLLALGFSRPGL